MNVTAKATRSGNWWAIEVPEIPGLFTQARRLEQVSEMVVDAAGLLGYHNIQVEIQPKLADAEAALLEAANANRKALKDIEAKAAASSRAAVERLRADGLPVRDVAILMGISPQRVSALAAS